MVEMFDKKEVSQADKIINLKSEGLSIRQIAVKLGIPKSTIQDIIKNSGVSESVRVNSDIVRDSVRECPKEDNTDIETSKADKENPSLAELKTKINSILRDIYKTIDTNKVKLKVLECKQEKIQEEFNSRINKFLLNALNIRLEAFREDLIKQCREIQKA